MQFERVPVLSAIKQIAELNGTVNSELISERGTKALQKCTFDKSMET